MGAAGPTAVALVTEVVRAARLHDGSPAASVPVVRTLIADLSADELRVTCATLAAMCAAFLGAQEPADADAALANLGRLFAASAEEL